MKPPNISLAVSTCLFQSVLFLSVLNEKLSFCNWPYWFKHFSLILFPLSLLSFIGLTPIISAHLHLENFPYLVLLEFPSPLSTYKAAGHRSPLNSLVSGPMRLPVLTCFMCLFCIVCGLRIRGYQCVCGYCDWKMETTMESLEKRY